MADKDKTREELLKELQELKQENISLKSSHDRNILERKLAEEEFEESEERFLQIAEYSPDMIYRMSLPDGNYEYVSRASTAIFGYTPDDFRNSPILIREAIHPDWQEYFKEQWEMLLAGKMSPIYQYQIVHGKTGKVHWIRQSNTLIRNHAGQPIAIEGSVTDITELKQVEQALQEAKETAEMYLNISADLIFTLDTKGMISLMNETGARLLGYNQGELNGKNWFDTCLPKEIRSEIWAVFQKLMNGDIANVTTYENTVITKSGEVRMLLWHNSLLRDNNGEINGLLSSAQDITESKQGEKALRESEGNLKNTFNLSPSIIAKANLNTGFYIEANQAVTRILGYSIEEFTSKPYTDLVHPDDIPKTTGKVSEQTKGNEVFTFENRFLCKDGSYKWLSWNATSADSEGIALGVASDITDRKKAEVQLKTKIEEINIAKEKAEENEKLLNETGKIGKVGGWGFNIDTLKQRWTEETYLIHEVDFNYDPNVENGINFYTPTSQPIIDNAVKRAIEFGEEFNLDLEIITAKNNLRNVNAVGKPDLENRRVYGFIQDITVRKQADKKVRESDKFLKEIIESMSDGFSILDEIGIHINVNPAFCKMTGFTKEELIGTCPPHPYWPKEEYKNIELAFEKTTHGNFEKFELVFKKKNGVRFPVLVNPSQIKDEKGNVKSNFATVIDITESRQKKNFDRVKRNSMA
jgi:PAS domain S-box-containing protein